MLKIPLRGSGFALVELIITLTIAGILTAIAIPEFNTIISNNRLTAYSNEFVGALNLARSEAIKRGTQVTVMRLGSKSTEWQWGWQVFVDIADQPSGNHLFEFKEDTSTPPCQLDASGAATEDCLLRIYSKSTTPPQFLPEKFSFLSAPNSSDAIGFNAIGKNVVKGTGLPNTTLILCDKNRGLEAIKSAKVIIINNTGRIRIGVDTDQDDIPERTPGQNITSCDLP